MPYIYFTDEQKLRANSVDLERYLLQNGEELIRSGPEKRLKSDKSITIRGSEWFDHAQADQNRRWSGGLCHVPLWSELPRGHDPASGR